MAEGISHAMQLLFGYWCLVILLSLWVGLSLCHCFLAGCPPWMALGPLGVVTLYPSSTFTYESLFCRFQSLIYRHPLYFFTIQDLSLRALRDSGVPSYVSNLLLYMVLSLQVVFLILELSNSKTNNAVAFASLQVFVLLV